MALAMALPVALAVPLATLLAMPLAVQLAVQLPMAPMNQMWNQSPLLRLQSPCPLQCLAMVLSLTALRLPLHHRLGLAPVDVALIPFLQAAPPAYLAMLQGWQCTCVWPGQAVEDTSQSLGLGLPLQRMPAMMTLQLPLLLT